MTKRDAICDAALELFAEKGIEATTIRDIAQRADAAEGTLYRHFKGKEEDWQEHEEKSFAKDLAHELNQAADQGRFDRVVVVAPDRFLGELRPNLSGRVSDHIHAEVHKDLTHARIDELEQHLADVMPV